MAADSSLLLLGREVKFHLLSVEIEVVTATFETNDTCAVVLDDLGPAERERGGRREIECMFERSDLVSATTNRENACKRIST